MGMGNKASQATVDGLKRAAAIAYQEGYVIRVTSGYRPLSRQIANVCTKIKNNDTSIGGSIAWPGGSNHGIGVAVDAELLRNGKVLVSSADLPEGSSCERQAAGTLAKPEDTRTFDRIMTQAGAVRYTNEMWHYEFNSPITSCRCKYPDCPAPPRTCTHKPC
jgi:D-alanyl-D-alanine dipeptidase